MKPKFTLVSLTLSALTVVVAYQTVSSSFTFPAKPNLPCERSVKSVTVILTESVSNGVLIVIVLT